MEDKKAFKKWCKENLTNSEHHIKSNGIYSRAVKSAWVAACDYKNKEINELKEKIEEHLLYTPKLQNKEQWQLEMENLKAGIKEAAFIIKQTNGYMFKGWAKDGVLDWQKIYEQWLEKYEEE